MIQGMWMEWFEVPNPLFIKNKENDMLLVQIYVDDNYPISDNDDLYDNCVDDMKSGLG